MNPHSPVLNTALTPLFSSASTYPAQGSLSFQPRPVLLDSHRLVHPFTQLSNVKLDRFHTSRQRPWDVINMLISLTSPIQYSPAPESKTEGTNPSPFSSETGEVPLVVPTRSSTTFHWSSSSTAQPMHHQQRDVQYSPDCDFPCGPLPRSRTPADSRQTF